MDSKNPYSQIKSIGFLRDFFLKMRRKTQEYCERIASIFNDIVEKKRSKKAVFCSVNKGSKLTKLISYYKPYKKELFLDLFFSALSALATVAIPLVMRYIINDVINFESQKAIRITILLAISILLLFVLLYFCNKYMKNQGKSIAIKIEEDMCVELFEHYQKLSFSFYDEQSTGKLLSRMTVDVRNISEVLHLIPERILVGFVIKFVAVFTAFFMINVIFGFVALCILVIIFTSLFHFGRKVDKEYMKSHESMSNFNGMVEESLSGIRTVQSLGNQQIENLKFRKLVKEHYKDVKSIVRISSTVYATMMSFINGLIPIMAVIAIIFGIYGHLNLGELITLMLFTDIILQPIWQILELMEIAQNSWAGYKRFTEVLSIKPEIDDSPNAITLKNINGNIEFKHVSFNYGKVRKSIFKDLNFEINAGEYIALVGQSGAGKSTICNLIPRFYDVLNGEILVDGINVKDIKLESLRKSIGFVHQDTFLFSGTVMENISYGNPNSTDKEIIEAAKSAYAHDFITHFPEGYNAQIGQRGVKLSGGQKQRLAIARVFLKNPPILIFDEATSNLDNESERFIQKSMEELSRSRTTIVIAHRLSTIINARRILVISNGQIAEDGNHKELLNKNGIYAEFYNYYENVYSNSSCDFV